MGRYTKWEPQHDNNCIYQFNIGQNQDIQLTCYINSNSTLGEKNKCMETILNKL